MKTKSQTVDDRRVATLIRIYRSAVASGDTPLREAASLELSRYGISAKTEIRTDTLVGEDQDV